MRGCICYKGNRSNFFFIIFHRRSPSSLAFPIDLSPFPCVSSHWSSSSTLQQCCEPTARHSLMLIIHALCSMLCMCMDLRSLQLFCLIIWECSKMHCFVCRWASLMKVGKIFPSHFVMPLNKRLEVTPSQLAWSWFEGMLHEVLNLINFPSPRP